MSTNISTPGGIYPPVIECLSSRFVLPDGTEVTHIEEAIFGESYTLKATVPEGAFFVKWNTHRYDDVNSGIYPNSQPNTITNSPNTSFNNTFVKNMLIVPICNTN